jgi:helicase MOV-10
MVKLVKNFRSHEAILKFPNERFYNGDLQQCGDPRTINFFLESPLLASRNFPIVFHAIHGKDDREATSPSFFNIDEVSLVKDYVRMLRADRRLRISMCPSSLFSGSFLVTKRAGAQRTTTLA